jgi:hypothetical protein
MLHNYRRDVESIQQHNDNCPENNEQVFPQLDQAPTTNFRLGPPTPTPNPILHHTNEKLNFHQ